MKENWLIVLLIVLVVFFIFGSNIFGSFSGISQFNNIDVGGFGKGVAVMESATFRGGIPSPISDDFAPDVLDRKIVKSTSMSTEVERGAFKQAESSVLDIVKSSESILLNQNSNRIGKDKKSYFVGRYTIKVDTEKYEAVVSQLKNIGEVTNFNENQQDVTGRFENINIEIQTEQAKLVRYQQLFDDSKEVEFKIQLTDRIFNQERRIKYLEDSLKNIDQRVDYSTISLTLTEEQSEYINIIFVKFSELIKGFVGSINLLLKLFFNIIPWVIAIIIIRFLYKLIKGRNV